MVPVGAVGGFWAVSGVGGSAGALCGLAAFAVLGVLLVVPVGGMGPFWPVDGSFRAVRKGGVVGCVQSRELGAQRLAFRGLSCWEASVTFYLWFRF